MPPGAGGKRKPRRWPGLETPRVINELTRRLITALRPPILDQFGIVSAIQNLVSEMTASGGPQIGWRPA